MATLSVTAPTLVNAAKLLNPDGSVARVAEILAQQNPILQDMVFLEANGPVSHRTTIRTGYATPAWRKLNEGVAASRGDTRQITAGIGMLESYSEVDKALTDLSGDPAAYRFSEDTAHMEGMNNEFASTLIYGDETTEPEAFTGFTPGYNANSGATNALNVILHGGSGTDNTSIWLVVWGPNTIFGVYPKGSQAGLTVEDKGQVTLSDSSGNSYEGYRTHFVWKAGLVVRDWRYAVRVCNIDVSDLATLTNTDEIVDSMSKAISRIPNLGMGTPVFYMNRTVLEAYDLGLLQKSSAMSAGDISGRPVIPTFRGIPVKRCDAILNTEALVS